jgi:hypothetical protein
MLGVAASAANDGMVRDVGAAGSATDGGAATGTFCEMNK